MEINKEDFLILLTEIFQSFLSDHNISSFPGNLPISLQKTHLFQLMFGYLLALKADGERCFIFICQNKVFTINRNLEIKNIGSLETSNLLYLFDAECIPDLNLILLFDTLIFQSKKKHNVLRSDITQRNELARFFTFFHGQQTEKDIFENYKYPSNYPNSEIILDSGWRLQTKPLFLYHHLNDVWTNRHHCEYETDGIVFSRQWASYQPYTNDPMSLIKWKPLTTIDFFVVHLEPDEQLVSIPPEFSKYQSSFGNFSLLTTTKTTEYKEIFTHINLDQKYENLIVEFFWENNSWQPLKIRFDKKSPNTLKTVCETLKNINDPISIRDFYLAQDGTSV